MTECPIVETPLGKAKGIAIGKSDGGKDVFRYSSLPFAKPPVDKLKFKPPVSPDPWNGTLDASKHTSAPMQDRKLMDDLGHYIPSFADIDSFTTNEDCLYLSVYTSNPSKKANLPVLFWIYGGGFIVGGESFYDARVIASLHDVVVVIPNYRVSIWGFLALGNDTDCPGNMGLLDQIMAMKWTKNNIKAFGGNPDNVTIFGESAGSMSVSYHVVSPLSTGLFRQAISHSGTFFNSGFPMDNGEKPVNMLLEKLKIKETDPKAVLEKLKSTSTEELLKVIQEMMETHVYFGPVYDGKFFPKPMLTMKKEPVANNVPYIVGCNNTEGHGVMVLTFPKDFQSGISEQTYNESLKGFVGGAFYERLPDEGFDVITKEFEKDKKKDDKMKWSKMYGEILADILFISPTVKALNQHVASKGKVFMYVMTQQPQYNHTGPEVARKADFCECDHGDDLIFTFGMPLTNRKLKFEPKFTESEKKLSREWLKYITNFATSGDPNVGAPVSVKWPEYNLENRQHLSVQHPCSVGKKFGLEREKFWSDVVEPMIAKPGDTKL